MFKKTNKNQIRYKDFIIEYGNFYGSGERWYIWSEWPSKEINIDPSRKGFETLKQAKAAIDEYKKASQ